MSQKISWPPKDFERLMALVTLFIKEPNKASMSLFKERLGITKSTVNRYLRIMREVFGMKIYFLRQGKTGKYVVEDYGCFDPKWFKKLPRVAKPKKQKTDAQADLKVSAGQEDE